MQHHTIDGPPQTLALGMFVFDSIHDHLNVDRFQSVVKWNLVTKISGSDRGGAPNVGCQTGQDAQFVLLPNLFFFGRCTAT